MDVSKSIGTIIVIAGSAILIGVGILAGMIGLTWTPANTNTVVGALIGICGMSGILIVIGSIGFLILIWQRKRQALDHELELEQMRALHQYGRIGEPRIIGRPGAEDDLPPALPPPTPELPAGYMPIEPAQTDADATGSW